MQNCHKELPCIPQVFAAARPDVSSCGSVLGFSETDTDRWAGKTNTTKRLDEKLPPTPGAEICEINIIRSHLNTDGGRSELQV